MNILLHSSTACPEVTGGSEIYVHSLARALQELGLRASIAAPSDQVAAPAETVYDGVPLFRYPRSGDNYRLDGWRRPDAGLPILAAWMRRQRFDVYHLHAWSAQTNWHHVRLARSLGLPVFLTCHLPYSCTRTTMLEHGREPCDGVFRAQRCARCLGFGPTLSPRTQALLTRLPPLAAELAERTAPRLLHERLSRHVWVNLRGRMLARAIRAAERVISVSAWYRDVLIRNGAPAEKIVHAPLGISQSPPRDLPPPPSGAQLEVAFLGRIGANKGVKTLLDGVCLLSSDTPLRLTFYGVTSGEPDGEALAAEIRAASAAGRHVAFGGPLARAGVWRMLASVDVLAVPSTWKEMGPTVVLEANAVGAPALGSDFGGLSELIRPGVNGWLVPDPDFRTSAGWAEALRSLALRRDEVRAMRPRVPPPRTMRDVAAEMQALYAGATRLRGV